jgi:hypothetical protein
MHPTPKDAQFKQLRKPDRVSHLMTPLKALPPCVSHLTPSRRKAFVPKFLHIESFRCGWRCYFAFCFSVNAFITKEIHDI